MIVSAIVDSPDPDDQRTELTAAELRTLAHPLRIRIMTHLGGSAEPATSAALARALGESTGATSYHLRQLAKLGLITEVPGYGTARERGWRAGYRSLSLTPDSAQSTESQAALWSLFAAVIAHDDEVTADFLRQRESYPVAWRDVFRFVNQTLHLRPEEVDEVSARIQDVLADYVRRDPAERPEGAEPVYAVIRLTPAQTGEAQTEPDAT